MRCAQCRGPFMLGRYRMRPQKPYPEPRPEFCTKDLDNPRACYDSYFEIPANKEKLHAYTPPVVPIVGTVVPLRPG